MPRWGPRRTVTALFPFRRNWAVAESRAETARDDRTSWQERMGLTVEEALELPGLAGTTVAAGASGLGRVVRHMVVDDPADPLAAAGPDVLVVLGARLPPADPANCRALVERLDSMGTAALAFRRTEGPAPGARRGARRGRPPRAPVLALPRARAASTRSSPRCSAPSSPSRARRSRSPPAWTTSSWRSRSPAAGWPRSPQRLAVMLDGAAVLGLGPDREVVTSAGPPDDVAEISDWLWLLDAAADDALAELTPSRRLSGVRADQTVVTPADVLADADLSPADGILLVPGHHELPGGVGEYAVAPIMAGDQRHGWLVAVHRHGAMMLGAGGVLERAAVIAALSVIRLQAVHSVELRFQGDLVRRLVGGSVGHTERTLAYTRSFGWRLDGPVAVLVTATETVADAQPPTRPRPSTSSTGWPTAGGPRWSRRSPARPSPGWPPRSSPCCRWTAARPRRSPRWSPAVTSRVNGRLRRVGRLLGTGIGRPAESLSALAEAHRQAQRALGVGQEIHGGTAVTHFDQLGVFRLLSLIPDSTELRSYVDEVLGPLADAGRRRLRRPARDPAGAAGDQPQRRRVGPPAALPLQHDALPDRQAGADARPVHHGPDAAAEPAARPARGPHAGPRPAAPAAGRGRVHRRRRTTASTSPALNGRGMTPTSPRSSRAWPTCSAAGGRRRPGPVLPRHLPAHDAGGRRRRSTRRPFEDAGLGGALGRRLRRPLPDAPRGPPGATRAAAAEPWRLAFGADPWLPPEAHVLLGHERAHQLRPAAVAGPR